MKQLLRLLKNFTLLLLVLFVLDRGIGNIIKHFLLTEKQGDSSILTHALTAMDEDITIIGSSRAAHHYISSQIEKTPALSVTTLAGMVLE